MQLDLPFLRRGTAPDAEIDGSLVEGTTRDPGPPVEFVRMRRARRYILRMRSDGVLRVTIPRGGSKREAERFVGRQQSWIARERRRVDREHAPGSWGEGTVILLRGVPFRIRLRDTRGGRVASFADRDVRVEGKDVRRAVEDDLRALARDELVPRLLELAREHECRPGAVTIRNQRSRWGSCARNGSIALNFRLVQMPADIRDYVMLHELMHLRHQNHSLRFWKLVSSVYPAYREAERWLRVQGRSLF